MKTRFLDEAPGVRSWVRLQSLLLTVLFMVVVMWEAYKQAVNIELLILLGALAVAPKVFQKMVEARTGKQPEP